MSKLLPNAGDRILIYDADGDSYGSWFVSSVYVEGWWAYQYGDDSTPQWFARAVYRWKQV